MDLKYIVVGTGRSGTVFMAKVLTQVGFPCGHETIFNERGIFKDPSDWDISHLSKETTGDWIKDKTQIVADSSYMAVPHLQDYSNAKVIHVIRNPLKVVRSFYYGMDYFKSGVANNPWEDYIYKYVPELKKDMSQLERCCLYYVLWNQMVCRKDLFYHVEEDVSKVLEFLNRVDIEVNVSNKTNTFTLEGGLKNNLTSENIPEGEVKQRFLEYSLSAGYNLDFKIF